MCPPMQEIEEFNGSVVRGFDSWVETSSGEGNGNSIPVFLARENSMDRGARLQSMDCKELVTTE